MGENEEHGRKTLERILSLLTFKDKCQVIPFAWPTKRDDWGRIRTPLVKKRHAKASTAGILFFGLATYPDLAVRKIKGKA